MNEERRRESSNLAFSCLGRSVGIRGICTVPYLLCRVSSGGLVGVRYSRDAEVEIIIGHNKEKPSQLWFYREELLSQLSRTHHILSPDALFLSCTLFRQYWGYYRWVVILYVVRGWETRTKCKRGKRERERKREKRERERAKEKARRNSRRIFN